MINVCTGRNNLWTSHSEQKSSTEKQTKSDYLSKLGLTNTQTVVFVWYATCVDTKGKRYYIELDEIAPLEDE